MLAEAHLSDLYAFQFSPQVAARKAPLVDTDTEIRGRRVVEKFTESVGILTAEPSMGLFRIQEHVRRTLPQLVEKKMELQGFQYQVEGVCYDLEYSIRTVQSMQKIPHFTIIKECLKSAMTSKKNLEEAEARRQLDGNKLNSAQSQASIISLHGEILEEGFICPMCMEKWNSQEELLDHWRSLHSPSVSPSDTSSATTPSPDLHQKVQENSAESAEIDVENSSTASTLCPDSSNTNEGVSDNSVEL